MLTYMGQHSVVPPPAPIVVQVLVVRAGITPWDQERGAAPI